MDQETTFRSAHRIEIIGCMRFEERLVGGGLLERLVATDRLHGDPGLAHRAVSAAFAHRCEPLSGAVS